MWTESIAEEHVLFLKIPRWRIFWDYSADIPQKYAEHFWWMFWSAENWNILRTFWKYSFISHHRICILEKSGCCVCDIIGCESILSNGIVPANLRWPCFLSRTIKRMDLTMLEPSPSRGMHFRSRNFRLWYLPFIYDSHDSSCKVSFDHYKSVGGCEIINCELRSSSTWVLAGSRTMSQAARM